VIAFVLPRFYLDGPLDRPSATLTGTEAHHLARVLRAGRGDRVALFDGRGTEAVAEVTDVSRRAVELRLIDCATTSERGPRVVLGTAAPKGDRFRWLVEKATELGVTRLVPLRTARAVVDPSAGRLSRTVQSVIAACKQSGRNRLMEIGPVTEWQEFVAGEIAGQRTWLADPAGRPVAAELTGPGSADGIVLAVGPEGGLTDDEREQAVAAGARPVSLGPHILRIETAAIALAAAARFAGQP
jgi:16S rRNA (uracil1498-N3)-methyltransferase